MEDQQASIHLYKEIDNLKASINSLEQGNRQLQLELQQVQEKSWTGNWSLNLMTKEVQWSQEMYDILEVPKDQPASMQLFNERLDAIGRDKLGGAIRRVFLTKENYSFEHDIRLPEKLYHVRTDLHIELDDQKNPKGLQGITTDITSVKTAQKELEKLSLVASKTNNAVVLMRLNTEIEWVNEGFIRMTGTRLDEIRKQPFKEILGDQRVKWADPKELFGNLTQNHSFEVESKLSTKKWSNIWTLINLTPILDYELKPTNFIAIITDIDQRKKDEQLLQEQKDEIEKKNTLLEESLRALSREQIGRKALLITFLVGVVLILISEAFIDPIIEENMKGHTFAVLASKVLIAGLLKPIEDLVRRKLMRDEVRKKTQID